MKKISKTLALLKFSQFLSTISPFYCMQFVPMSTNWKMCQDQHNGPSNVINAPKKFFKMEFLNYYFVLVNLLVCGVLSVARADDSVKYEINSESVTLKRNDGTQSDLKLLLGYEVNHWDGLSSRFSLGGYRQEQSSREFGGASKTGPVFQFKQNLYRELLFFSYENFSYRRDEKNNVENKVGFFGGYNFRFNHQVSLDSYMETFLIREVSEKDLLTAARVSFLIDSGKTERLDQLDGLLEIYHKSGPHNWGDSYSDVRLGIRIQPWNFLSCKIFSPILTTQTGAGSYLEGQINIFYDGDLTPPKGQGGP